MIELMTAGLDGCGKCVVAIMAACLPFMPFMRRKWPGLICEIGGWTLFLLILAHCLGL